MHINGAGAMLHTPHRLHPPLLLSADQTEGCRQLLLEVLHHPVLGRRLAPTYTLAARAKTLAADLILACHTPLKPADEFLHFLLTEPCQPPETRPFFLSPLELAADATKLFQGVAKSQNVWACASSGGDRAPSEGAGSVGVSTWELLSGLLGSLERLARVFLEAGNMREAFYYAREGIMASKQMLLQGW